MSQFGLFIKMTPTYVSSYFVNEKSERRYVFYKKNKKIILDIKFRENIYVLLIKLKNTSGKKHAFMK